MRAGTFLSSSDVHGGLRIQSHSYGYTTDPAHGVCRGVQCPDTLDVWSDHSVRMIAGGHGNWDVITNNQPRFSINADGIITIPGLSAPTTTPAAVCITDTGVLMLCGHQ